ncbi:MAG: hypothetical protein IH820_01165 [Bacteroidetes bacterium]|nr:hypothetical protein [Bacteroidota bacterium]
MGVGGHHRRGDHRHRGGRRRRPRHHRRGRHRGAYFGDKLSPLSDTTNLAALAADVDLFDHIRSMMVTTVPSALLASVLFLALGFIYPPTVDTAALTPLTPFLDSLRSLFRFNPLLLLPPAMVLYGSLKKKPTIRPHQQPAQRLSAQEDEPPDDLRLRRAGL